MDTKEYKVIITPNAYREINRIYKYILEDLYAEKAAKNLMVIVEKKIKQLKYQPRKYSKIEKLDDLQRDFRRIVIKNYVLLYTIDEDSKRVYVSHLSYSKSNYINKKF